jgi:glucose/arabinose dehydrogenase
MMKVLTWVLAVSALVPVHAGAQLRTEVVATGLSQPVAFVPDPYFANTFYIVEQTGLVKVLRDGQVQSTPFADLRHAISPGGERGLLGMAFAPDVFSGRVFFNFTNAIGDTVIARFVRTAASPFEVVAESRVDLRWHTGERFIDQPYPNHNGGNLAFGADGYLYIGLGDGGSGNDPENYAQDPATLLGKMLRIDVNVASDDPAGYRVPADNPFLDGSPIPALGEIWAFGLRNPWRYSFDDLGAGATGALVIADVGQGALEEINYESFGAGGRNYGWRIREGRLPTEGVEPTTPAFNPLVDPVFNYDRDQGQAVTGGYVYRGTALPPAYRGRYFFADFITSRVWSLALALHPITGEATASNLIDHTDDLGDLGGVASFGRDRDGELYLLTFTGHVLKIVPQTGPAAPNAPESFSAVVSGSIVTVSWTPPSSGTLPSAYQLEAGSVPGGADLAVVRALAPQTSLTFSGIPPDLYYARVRGLSTGGAGPASDEIAITVRACIQPPPVPASFASAVNGQLVTLSWAVPGTEDGPTQFVIEAGSASGESDLGILTVEGVLRDLSVNAPPGTYFVRLRGVNTCGSATSAEIVVTVL